MKKLLCLLGMLSLTAPAWACVNKSGTKYGGGSGGYDGWRFLEASLKRNVRPDGVEMEASLRGATKFEDRSDYAIALMYLDRSPEAIALLTTLEQEQPGHFFIAANLGTAYELSGKYKDALHWINEGIRRNPQDHEGTEWLHAKILDAKIAQQKNPDYFEMHSVLELQPNEIGRAIQLDGKSYSAAEVRKAIEYQLEERLQFVKPPDPAVASLLYDYAAIESVLGSMESAQHILKFASNYGYPAEKIAVLNTDFDRRLAWGEFKTIALICTGVLVFLGVLRILYRRGIFVISRKDLKR